MSEHADYIIPPDHEVGEEIFTLSTPKVWHFPGSEWDPVRQRFGGEGVNIAILDTGGSPHPNLPEPKDAKSEIQGQSAVRDGNGHGTHVAGTALGSDGIGGSPKAGYLISKVLSDQGGGGSDGIARGIRWAADAGADIINMSLGGGSSYRPTNDAIDYAWSKGCLVLAAAGNSGYRGANTVGWPAKYSNCICVGATQRNGQIANFSSGGRELDVATPGQNIVSCSNRGSGFRDMSGTSMATPFLAGLMGNVVQAMRELGRAVWTAADAVRAFFDLYSDDRGQPGKDVRFGVGVPNISKILQALRELAEAVRL